MSITLSPNMNLPIPTVGQEDGPQYATDVNNSLTIVDQHTHGPGSGVPITPSAISINSSLTFNNNFATGLSGLVLVAQLSTPDVNTIYQSGVDLFFVDGLGNDVQITQNGAVAGTPGSIANLVPPASASYVSGNSTFVWQSDTNVAANMDFGSALLRNLTPNSTNALTLAPPAALSSNYTITLPNLPVATSFLTIDASGNIGATPSLTAGITGSMIASQTITATNIDPGSIGNSQLASSVRQINKAIFTSSTTFTTGGGTTANTVYKITCVGSGGGGGQWSSGAGGGGGGATSIAYASSIAAGTVLTITVGVGGLGTNLSVSNGGDGNLSQVQLPSTSRLCTATGGFGGIADGSTIGGGAGGSVTGGIGDILIAGGTGGNSSTGAANVTQGNGGDSTMGGGGRGGCSAASRVGAAGGAFGGGGGGSTAGGSGAGANGIVLIEWVQ